MFKLRYILVVNFSIFYLIGNTQVVDDTDPSVQDSMEILQEEAAITPLDSIPKNITDTINNEDVETEPTDEFDDSFIDLEDSESQKILTLTQLMIKKTFLNLQPKKSLFLNLKLV